MKEKILEELNRRYDEYHAKYKETYDHYHEGKADALDLFEQFIESLPDF